MKEKRSKVMVSDEVNHIVVGTGPRAVNVVLSDTETFLIKPGENNVPEAVWPTLKAKLEAVKWLGEGKPVEYKGIGRAKETPTDWDTIPMDRFKEALSRVKDDKVLMSMRAKITSEERQTLCAARLKEMIESSDDLEGDE